jgi:ubiquinone/menaquinone biosynthesis C-methylase UbiE
MSRAEDDVRTNRQSWDADSDDYQQRNASQLNTKELAWGTFAVPEDELKVLGPVEGKDILEFGCGACQWSIFLTKRGARPVGFDLSGRQLEHARRLMGEFGVRVPVVQASALSVPFRDRSFDIVFCDFGAMTFADPHRTVPEAARLLREGGLLAFTNIAPLFDVCADPVTEDLTDRLHRDYFGMHRFQWTAEEGLSEITYQLTYGEWIRLFRRNGFLIEDLIEFQAPEGVSSTYRTEAELAWMRRWPGEHL